MQQSLPVARQWINPAAGILGVAMGKSSDHPGEAAVIVYVDEAAHPAIQPLAAGVRTVIIPATARAVALGAAPMSVSLIDADNLSSAALSQALSVRRQHARDLMQQYPAFFGLGVGQSLDNPREAALVIYVDRRQLPAVLPTIIGGVRTRYVVMDRLHVTRSYATPFEARRHCMPHEATGMHPAASPRPRTLPLP